MDWTPYVGPIVTALIAAGGTYAAVASRLARLEAKLDDLRHDVEKHNGVIERTYELEARMTIVEENVKIGGTK